jgi:ketosteroid isomerase-like protein
METAEAQAYATDWIDAWNTRDLDNVLPHYADNVVFRSPIAARVRPETGGVVVGKSALTDYWTAALAGIPDLHFTLEDAFASVGGLTILYRNQRGGRVAETLLFNDEGLVVLGLGAYAAAPQ